MTHDPLCPEPDYPIARKCPSCQNYFAVREDMLAKCIAELEALMAKTDGDRFHGFWDSIAALRVLQEKP